jgi:hypothetical protein
MKSEDVNSIKIVPILQDDEIEVETKIERDILFKLRGTDPYLNTSILNSAPSEFPIEDLEDLIEESNQFTYTEKLFYLQPRAIYPPQLAQFSSIVLISDVSQTTTGQNRNSVLFLDMLKNAYSVGKDEGSSTKGLIRCNLIMKDISNIHSFEFENEYDYWIFIANVKRSISGYSISSYKGKCKYSSNKQLREENSTTNGNISTTTTNTSRSVGSNPLQQPKQRMFSIHLSSQTNANHNPTDRGFSDKFEIVDGKVLVTAASNPLLQSDHQVDLKDVMAYALTVDHKPPQAYVMEISLRLPSNVLKFVKSDGQCLDIQFATTSMDKRQIHHVFQVDRKGLPYEGTDTHYGIISLSEDLLGLSKDLEVALPSKELSPVNRSGSVVSTNLNFKCTWEIEIYSDMTNGKLLGKKSFPFNPFLDQINTRSMEADLNRITANRSNTTILTSTVTTGYRSRAKSVKASPIPSSPQRRTSFDEGSVHPKNYTPPMVRVNSSGEGKLLLNQNSQSNKTILRVKDSIKVDIEILEKQFNKALRIFIKRATGIVGPKKNVAPSAYCTVYLVGKNGNRLTSNHAEVRTEPIKDFEPTWNKEILLQDSKLGIDEVDKVMVLIRDSASGILKHRHIGQVLIPIDCFLPQDEATFSLPLEPSYRMDEKLAERSYIGEIELTTQLVNVEIVDEEINLGDIYDGTGGAGEHPDKRAKGEKHSSGSKNSRLSVRNKSMEMSNGLISCTLHRSLVSNTWWPFKLLASAGNQTSSTNHLKSKPKPTVHDGFVLAAPLGLILKVIDSRDFSLDNCKEQTDGFISVPWTQVSSLMSPFDSSLIMSCDLGKVSS